MNRELKDKALEAAQLEVEGILAENWEEITEAYEEAKKEADKIREFNPKKRFAYGVSLKLGLQPSAGDLKISAAAAWAVTHKDETEGVTVSDQPELPLDPVLEGKDVKAGKKGKKIDAQQSPEELAAQANAV